MMAVAVKVNDLPMWADKIEWHLRSFCRVGHTTPERLLQDVSEKRRQMWLAVDECVEAAVLTAVSPDDLQTLRITHAAGCGRENWVHLLPIILDWGREVGCKYVEATCRPGWEKTLKDFGLRKRHIVMEGTL